MDEAHKSQEKTESAAARNRQLIEIAPTEEATQRGEREHPTKEM